MAEKPNYEISVLTGDGIGPELTEEVIKILTTTQEILGGFFLNYTYFEASAGLYLRTGEILPRDEYGSHSQK